MYVQHNGVAMGASLAPVIADIFMAHMETTLMDELKRIGVCEWHRYVDDTFVCLTLFCCRRFNAMTLLDYADDRKPVRKKAVKIIVFYFKLFFD
jgi:hypothetical protein